jgi:lysozyme family protein/peptidoglycan hydrolase-like protein with peptidoglycan-binding domain
MVSFPDLKDGYERNWASLQIRPARLQEASNKAKRLLKGKDIYQQIEAITKVPWWFAGLCHSRESDFDFDTYLGNGQALGRVTTIVPKGRGPFTGPNAFVNGAVDAFRLEGFLGATDWSIARTLFRLEGFNGFGYQNKGVPSPYVYGGSNIYGPPEARGGKFIRDHVFDPNTVDIQLGAAVLLKRLMDLDQSINFDGVSVPEGSTGVAIEPEEELAQTVLLVQQSLNKLGTDPRLAEDGKNGPKTMAAISQFQQQNGLKDTGLPDAATIAAMAQKSTPAVSPMQLPIDLSQVLQRIQNLEQMLRPSTTDVSKPPNDPIGLVERLLPLIQKGSPNIGTASPAGAAPSPDQLKQVIDLLNAVFLKDGKPALGQVNGALGTTIGNLLNGKKTAIGILGATATAMLAGKAPVAGAAAAGGLEGLLGMIAPILPPQIAGPIFIATTLWGILGKMEKWNQGTAPPPKI